MISTNYNVICVPFRGARCVSCPSQTSGHRGGDQTGGRIIYYNDETDIYTRRK